MVMTRDQGTPVTSGELAVMEPFCIDFAPDTEPRPSKLRTLGRWTVAGSAAIAGTLGMLKLVQPEDTFRAGVADISLSANGHGGVNVLGENLDSPIGLVGLDVNLKVPDIRSVPNIVQEVSEITRELEASDKDLTEVVTDRYKESAKDSMMDLNLKLAALTALSGGLIFMFANEKIKSLANLPPKRLASLAAGGMAVGSFFIGNVALAYNTFDFDEAVRQLDDEAIRPYLADYFTDATTKAVLSIDTASREIAKNLTRLDRYGTQLSLSRNLDPDLSYILIEADAHGRSPYRELEAIMRSVGAKTMISLGDITNRGTAAENELLAGPELLGVDLFGIQDMKECAEWDPSDPVTCAETGEAYDIRFLLGNHDKKYTITFLESIGAEYIDMEVFRLPGIDALFAAASDGCLDTTKNCSTAEKESEVNYDKGTRLKKMLEDRKLKPNIIFVADPDIALALDGYAPYIVSGGKHYDDLIELPKGSKLYLVGTSGQAFGRIANNASATVLGIDPSGDLQDCLVFTWQGLSSRVPPTVKECETTKGKF